MKEITLLKIVNAIAFITDIDIRIDTRKREVVNLKKIYYKIAKEKTDNKINTIEKTAHFVCTKNHGAALFHLKSVDHLLETYPEYQDIYNSVIRMLDGSIDVGVPKYIIEHLAEYSEVELHNIFETRLEPYRKLHKLKKPIEVKKVKENYV